MVVPEHGAERVVAGTLFADGNRLSVVAHEDGVVPRIALLTRRCSDIAQQTEYIFLAIARSVSGRAVTWDEGSQGCLENRAVASLASGRARRNRYSRAAQPRIVSPVGAARNTRCWRKLHACTTSSRQSSPVLSLNSLAPQQPGASSGWSGWSHFTSAGFKPRRPRVW